MGHNQAAVAARPETEMILGLMQVDVGGGNRPKFMPVIANVKQNYHLATTLVKKQEAPTSSKEQFTGCC